MAYARDFVLAFFSDLVMPDSGIYRRATDLACENIGNLWVPRQINRFTLACSCGLSQSDGHVLSDASAGEPCLAQML